VYSYEQIFAINRKPSSILDLLIEILLRFIEAKKKDPQTLNFKDKFIEALKRDFEAECLYMNSFKSQIVNDNAQLTFLNLIRPELESFLKKLMKVKYMGTVRQLFSQKSLPAVVAALVLAQLDSIVANLLILEKLISDVPLISAKDTKDINSYIALVHMSNRIYFGCHDHPLELVNMDRSNNEIQMLLKCPICNGETSLSIPLCHQKEETNNDSELASA
jgi:hypothetical protein